MKLHQIFFASFYEPKKLAAFRLLPIGKMFQYVFLFIFLMTFVSFGRSIFDDLNEFEVADEVLEFGSALGALQYPITFVLALTVSTFYIFIRLSIVAAIGLGLLRLTNRRGDFRQIFQTTAFAATCGMLVPRSRERLEHQIDDYVVIERDGMIIGCAALHRFDEAEMGELACVAVHDDYRGGARGELLLAELERRARRQGLSALFALTTHTTHWFFEHGFRLADLEALPPLRRDTYNHARKSKVLVKSLG